MEMYNKYITDDKEIILAIEFAKWVNNRTTITPMNDMTMYQGQKYFDDEWIYEALLDNYIKRY